MAKWLGEYNRDVQKNNWLDIKFLLKNLDYNRIWNVYNPKDDSMLNSLIEHPVEIIYYLNDTLRKRKNGLTKDQIAAYFKVKPGRAYYMIEAAKKLPNGQLDNLIERSFKCYSSCYAKCFLQCLVLS